MKSIIKNSLLFLLTLTSLTMISFSSSKKTGPLQPGDPAPKITATDQDGKQLSFPQIYEKGITLVYFYPKAFTPGCTAEACSLRDSYQTLKDQYGKPIQIIGVSRDQADQQKAFQQEHKLPFPLIADHDGTVATAFGVSTIPLLGLTSRQSFLIENGKIIWTSEHAKTNGAAQEVQAALNQLPHPSPETTTKS